MLKKFRERAGGESGFTLIELLVVMLILGILAAIAIPAFLNQKGKANDADGKVQARTMQTAMETCASDNTGTASYNNCVLTRIQAIEPTIKDGAQVDLLDYATRYAVTSARVSNTQNYFQITRASNGTITHDCGTTKSSATPPVISGDGQGGCPELGNW